MPAYNLGNALASLGDFRASSTVSIRLRINPEDANAEANLAALLPKPAT